MYTIFPIPCRLWIFIFSTLYIETTVPRNWFIFSFCRSGKGGIPVVSDSVSLRRGLLSLFDTVSHCVVSLKDKVDQNSAGFYHDNNLYYHDNYDSDELDYSGGLRRKQKLRPLNTGKRGQYSLRVEYPTQPGYGVNRGPQAAKGGYISRTKVNLIQSGILI